MTEVTFTVEITDEGADLLQTAAEVWRAIEEVSNVKVVGNSLTKLPPPFHPHTGHTGNCRCAKVEPTTIHTAKRGVQQRDLSVAP